MAIELLPGAPTSINCKIYPLNSKETKILKEFLEEEEKKGYITPGSSPYTAPVFFVGKKDSQELRPVMDYRELNKWMKRDNNPLPNIKIILSRAQLAPSRVPAKSRTSPSKPALKPSYSHVVKQGLKTPTREEVTCSSSVTSITCPPT